jgi:PAS domain S-box-containing protein
MNLRWIWPFLLGIGLLLGGFGLEHVLWEQPAYESLRGLAEEAVLYQELMLSLLQARGELSDAELARLKGDPELLSLLNRMQEGIETEADRRRLTQKVTQRLELLRLSQRREEESLRQNRFLWRLGLVVGLVLVCGWGLLGLIKSHRFAAKQEEALQNLLQGWNRGEWQVPPTIPASIASETRTLAALWAAVEETLLHLERGELPPATPTLPHPMAHQLQNLQKALKDRLQQESQQLKTIQGLAAFSEIIKEARSIDELSEKTIRLLCRLLDAHAGAIFVEQEGYFGIRGTYAYDLELAATRRFRLGEGFVGQAALEKRLLMIHPVPSSYLRLRSGLGETTPHTLLIAPLIFQDETYGIVELAALESFPPYGQAFLEKISEHIGAALANFISKAHLQALLEREQLLRGSLEEKQGELMRSMALLEEAQRQLLDSQAQLASQLLAIRSAALVAEVNPTGHIRYLNQTLAKLIGGTEESLIGELLTQRFVEEAERAAFEEALTKGVIWQRSVALAGEANSVHWLRLTMAPLYAGSERGALLIAFDVSREKEQEAQLRRMLEESIAQEERLREANRDLATSQEELVRIRTELEGQIAAIGNAAIVSETDLQGRIIRVNDLFLQMYGYTREEVIGQNHRILKSGHQSDEVFEDMWRSISKGQVWRGEVRNRSKEGKYYWVLLTITPVLSVEGKVLKYIGVSLDITAQKHQEEELRSALDLSQAQQQELKRYTQQLQAAQEEMRRTQSELRGQISAVNNAAIVAETTPEGQITFINDAFCAMSGYSREELLGQTHALLKSDFHEPGFYEQLWQTILKKQVWRGIFCNRRRDGSLYWVSTTITPVTDARGRLTKFIAVSFDLTPQIEQEARLRTYSEELRKAQAELRGQIQAVGNAAFLIETDPDGRLLYANEAASEAWGYTWSEIVGQNLRFLNSAHHPPEFWAELWQTIQQGQVWKGEILNKDRHGNLFWQLTAITPILDAEGRLYKYISVAFDITAQKRQSERIRHLLQEAQETQQALRSYATQLEKVQSELLEAQLELTGRINALNNAAIVSETDPQGIITFVNDEGTYAWGYTRDELIGKPHNIIRSEVHPPRFFERMWDRIQSGFVWQGEVQNRAKDGSTFWVYLTITPVLDQAGKPYKYIGVAFDITRQKVQAQRLKALVQQLESQQGAQESPSLPWFTTDKRGLITGASPILLEMLGYPAGQFIGQSARLLRSSQTPPETFLDMWATISRGKIWQGFLYNRNAFGEEKPYFLTIYPAETHYLALLLPAEEALSTLKATWLKNYAPLDVLRDYEVQLEAQAYEIEELHRVIDRLRSRNAL